MIDINKHRFYLFQILKDIYSNPAISSLLGFKGGTALMFFYDLPRCISAIEKIQSRKLLMGVGDLLDEKMKSIVRNKLKQETLEYLSLYQKYPILSI